MRRRDSHAAVTAAAALGMIMLVATLTTLETTRTTAPTVNGGTTAGSQVYRIYLAADGSDANSGLSLDAPLQTLAGAQEVLRLAAPQVHVEVRIRQGTYTAPPTTWTFLVPGHTVSFLPVDYDYDDGIEDIAGRPVFRGDGTSGFWFTGRLPRGHTGGDAGLRFYHLQVENYDRGGLALDGGTADVRGLLRAASAGFNGNTVLGMYFTELGSKWAARNTGYGGLDLVNSRRNLILHNHFVRLENSGPDAHLMHGVYLAHHSTENTIRNNRFETISGDPLRTRNDSNDNIMSDNVLRRTGAAAQYSDWFCDHTCAAKHKRSRECASHGNLFHGNDNVSGYRGKVADWGLAPGDQRYAGGAHCSNDGQARVRSREAR